MKTALQKIQGVHSSMGGIADRIAGVEAILGEMNAESKFYRLTLMVNCVQHILDDLQEHCEGVLSNVISDMKGNAA